MIRIAICDDIPLHMEQTKQLISAQIQAEQLSARIYSIPPEEFLTVLSEKPSFSYDIVIMDIELSMQENGIQLARRLTDDFPSCQVIFLSAYPKYMMAVYETEHIYFVYKKHMEEVLPKALKKALQKLSDVSHPHIFIKAGPTHQRLPLDSLLYAERQQRKTHLYTTSGTLTVTDNLESLMAQTAEYPFLIRCHNSFLVNLKHVTSLTRNELILENHPPISISRKYIPSVKQSFLHYLNQSF